MIHALAALVFFINGATPAARAQFGQNHVVIRDFDWRVRSTEHFDIYYYDGSEKLVPEAAEVLERAFVKLTKGMDIPVEPAPWLPESQRRRLAWKRRPFFLYASQNDFQQSNIVQTGDGTGGVTEPFKDRFMIYNDGTYEWLDEVTTHELVHIFQFHVLVGGFWKSGRILKTIVYPLWMMEGMPGHFTRDIEGVLEETYIRDAATSGGLIPLTKLERFGHLKPHQIVLAYKQGAAALDFIASQFGARKVGEMLRLFESRIETSQVLGELIGLDAFQFDAKYREWLENKYARLVAKERLREPTAFGMPLTRTPDRIPQFNTSPVFSPDGSAMYYVTTSAAHPPQLRRLDLRTGRASKLANIAFSRIENYPLGNFANLSRVLAITKDGRYLAFAGTKNHRDSIYVYDLLRARLETRRLPGFQQVSQPRFSPDGGSIAFSGMKEGFTDLYLYDLRTRAVRRLTEDRRDDEMPDFTPDGRAIIWSAEGVGAFGKRNYDRRLYKLDLATGERERLEDSDGEARDPVVSQDGRRVLFTLEKDGFSSEVAELELSTGKVRRLTRLVGGAWAPTYAPAGEIAFASMRRGSVHVYKGPRADFLDEEVPQRAQDPEDSEKFMLPGMGGVAPSSATIALGPERPYKFQYSTDLFLPAFFYSSAGGFFWTSYWQGSDLLGNHQNSALVSIAGRAYDYQTSYAYQRFRPALIAGAAGTSRRDLLNFDDNHTIDISYHTQFVGTFFPLDRYHRVETTVRSASEIYRDRTDPSQSENREARFGALGFVRDTSRGRYLVVTQGSRLRLDVAQAAEVLGGNRQYTFTSVEAHQFVPLGSQSALAFKAQGVASQGPNRQEFGVGGLGGVRGYGRSSSENVGTRLGVGTAEVRFPLWREINYYMWYFFPDFYFKSLFGTVFTDAGYAWTTEGQFKEAGWRSVRHSVGAGVRLYTFILQEFPLILAFDYAQRTTQNGGVFYFYIGQFF